MQIRFRYASTPLSDPGQLTGPDQFQAIESRFSACCERYDFREITSIVEINADHEVTILIQVDLSDSSGADEASEFATNSVRVFTDLASELGVSWDVGHELEPHLGTIDSETPVDDLIDEIRTTVDVARSLTGLIVDDEFVEPDSTFAGGHELAGDDSWSDLLETPDSFIRFPEWE